MLINSLFGNLFEAVKNQVGMLDSSKLKRESMDGFGSNNRSVTGGFSEIKVPLYLRFAKAAGEKWSSSWCFPNEDTCVLGLNTRSVDVRNNKEVSLKMAHRS